MTTITDEQLFHYVSKQAKVISEMAEKFPNLPILTIVVMAGDLMSRDIADYHVQKKGWSVKRAGFLVGSYARLDWYVDQYENGNLPLRDLLDLLPEEWPGCDPDDTDPKFLKLWKKAWKKNGELYLFDGPALPPKPILTVYRGQFKATDPLGIAWTTDKKIARKFANGASLLVDIQGVVLTRRIRISDVYAYLTGRGESGIICDPL